MAAGSVRKCVFFYLLFPSILSVTGALKCEEISISTLSRNVTFKVSHNESSIIAVCVHGGELTLYRLWGSVIVVLEFESTDVQFYEAESCSALNPANQSWASILQSFVTSRNVMDHIIFKHSPFKTSCFCS
ncbi:hypothetical protein OS493_002144 [Desmophyllum pertusum]|uniref:S-protein homolog n=1 Tax=Desmophyllum pertusum TaxID=174260 RepID=A0A9W9Z8C6_9CNID|nr:hypothetical protein OS493_002144 [Desmophyllum pertusum]